LDFVWLDVPQRAFLPTALGRSRPVGYPTQEEVELALRGMLKDRPHDLPDLSKAARSLAGRPWATAPGL
jgi:hypothetical protein